MTIEFLLNGEPVRLTDYNPTTTLLDWIRDDQGLKGTKEGCNEGDCGACTIMAIHAAGTKKSATAINACITFLPQVNGLALRTVEGMSGPQGDLHPIQTAMVDQHGSQCGFCTPGFVNSLVAAQIRGDRDFDRVLAGNLCRCTGYAPIIRAAESVGDDPDRDIPAWLDDMPPDDLGATNAMMPESADELAAWYLEHPDATLIAGATDVGLWVTKGLQDLKNLCFLARCRDLQRVQSVGDDWQIGAGVTIEELRGLTHNSHGNFDEMLSRFGSQQVRSSGTIGGNIANGSPIGDTPPALIAIGASLILRHGDTRREIPVEEFFIEYGKQDRKPGEFVEAVKLPKSAPGLRCYKISKRFDQDISTLLGCFNITVQDGVVTEARMAFGGMAGIPKRASQGEATLVGKEWNRASVEEAMAAMAKDFTPLNDMRGSATYRMTTAKNLLMRHFLDLQGNDVSVREVTA